MKKLKRITNWKTTIINFLKNNSKEYLLVIIIFIIGMFIGVMLVNNTSVENQQIIENYILNFIEKFKSIANLDKLNLLTTSIKDNIIFNTLLHFILLKIYLSANVRAIPPRPYTRVIGPYKTPLTLDGSDILNSVLSIMKPNSPYNKNEFK